jgi:hypothetical protein
MAAAKHNIVVDQGSDYNLKLTLKQNDVNMTNLVGYTVRSQVRTTKTASTVAATFTGSVIDDTKGIFMITLPAATTATMVPGNYYYDVEIYKGAYVTRLVEGKLTLTAEVTR